MVSKRLDRLWNTDLFCHSEVAAATEESLFGLDEGKERFLGAQRASE
jgi:hypothetical protein